VMPMDTTPTDGHFVRHVTQIQYVPSYEFFLFAITEYIFTLALLFKERPVVRA